MRTRQQRDDACVNHPQSFGTIDLEVWIHDTSILLRNQVTRVSMEMSYKIYSPNIQGVEIVQRAQRRARRARLTYMRKPKHDIGSEKPSEIDTTHAGMEIKHRRVSELTGSEGPQSPKDSSLGYYGADCTTISEMSPESTPAELYSPPPESQDGADYFGVGGPRRQGTRERRSPGMSRPHTPIAELPGEHVFYEAPADAPSQAQKPTHSHSPSDSSLGTNIDAVLANDRIADPKNGTDADGTAAGPSSPATTDEAAGMKTGTLEGKPRSREQSAAEGRPPHARGLSDTSVQTEGTAVSQPTPEELERWARNGEDVTRPMSP